MKKRFNFGRLGALALALTLVTSCLTGGTLAKYTTEVSGTGTAAVAKWSFKVNDSSETINNIALGDTIENYSNIKEKVIAPGTKGKFTLNLDASDSEVGVDYAVKIVRADGTTLPDNLKFEVDDQIYTLGASAEGTIAYDTSSDNMKKPLIVEWEWPYDDAVEDNRYAGKTWNLTITVTGKQIVPVGSTPTP